MTEEKAQMMQTPMMQASTHISITVEEHERLKLAEQHGRMLRRAYDLSLQENERLKRENEGCKYKINELNKIITDGKDAYYRLQRELNDKNYYSSQLFEENKNLKRLEENVKASIKRFKHWRESILKCRPGGNEDTEEYTKNITFLESLLK